ncbi:DUF1801 domain-containing protein [Streptomyces cyaneochromogenes]|uniref:DUF1801 domain-containing protein n=1 Tax=Streptomyces cyaneochromogenes TaxID=2496836 RepID=A0A3Q9ENG5_9ACTN|nr:DUF1801 domain-containing protein [Streptomyces cyaneochromogenes]AZQ32289.1 DUF1801 domain-containing protein [Streptomyces cyaneochromogenes]
MGKPQTIDEYIEGFEGQAREVLEQVRPLTLEAVPAANEASHAKHANVVFTPSTREAFDADLADFTTGKGPVKLPYGRPVPGDLLRQMIAFRVREHEDDGVLWM